ncbi:MAG TPA: ribonuclease Z [Gemmatimonadales bacterium]|nr:ribonuclease Z [Gemmatimonadales bacterium]
MDLDVVFLGTAGSAPTAGRGLPATLIRRGGERLLFDCGEGTQRQLLRSIGLVDLEEIFLTHFHADHFLGLPGMVKTFGLRGREIPLTIYGPPGLKALFGALRPLIGRSAFELRLVELEPNEELDRDGYRIAAFNVRHRVQAYGYALIEDDRPGRFDEQAAIDLGVRPGPDFGRLQRGEAVTTSDGSTVNPGQVLGETRRGRKLVLSGDTAPCDMTVAVAHGADLLVHEATFTEEEADRARETGHTTARAAAEIAAEAEIELLALTHLSPRHPAGALRAEARELFETTIVPRDFDRVDLPFPEKGGPVHVRADSDLPVAESRTPPQ